VNTAAGLPAGGTGPIAVEETVTINRPVEEVERLWRDPGTMQRLAGGMARVHEAGPGVQRWEVSGPMDRTIGWDMRLVEDRPGAGQRWVSGPGAPVPIEADVRYGVSASGAGTDVRVALRLEPPGGLLGAALGRLLQAVPRRALERALQAFRGMAEPGAA
jgi:uncharacterized membrane protein